MKALPITFKEKPRHSKGSQFSYSMQWKEDDSALDLSLYSDIILELRKEGEEPVFTESVDGGQIALSDSGSGVDDIMSGVVDASTMDIDAGWYFLEVTFETDNDAETQAVALSTYFQIIGGGKAGTSHEWIITITDSTDTASGERATNVMALAVQYKNEAKGYAANLNRADIQAGDAGKVERIKADESGWENVDPTELVGIATKQELEDKASLLVGEQRGKSQKGINAKGSRIAFMFDDGYERNYTNALPVFKKYGAAATIAVEIDEINQNYNGNSDLPVLTTEQLRELVDEGWEICNHPALTLADTEKEMYDSAKAENVLLRNLLTGEKVMSSAGVVTDGSLDYPEYSDFEVYSAVYRGGSRNDTSDKAFKSLFDKVRTINGPIASRGDHLYAFGKEAERTQMTSALVADTVTNTDLEEVINFIKGIASTNSLGIVYAHDVLDGSSQASFGSVPATNVEDLEAILKLCSDLGVAVVPYKNLFSGNALPTDSDNLNGTQVSQAGYTSEYDDTVFLNSVGRSIKIVSDGSNANIGTGFRTLAFAVNPYHKYRIRVRYKIDSDLGTSSIDHGLGVQFVNLLANTDGTIVGDDRSDRYLLNSGQGSPKTATSGWEEFEFITASGVGALGQIVLSLFNASGTVWVGQIHVEDLGDLRVNPIRGTSNFDLFNGKRIYIPDLENVGERGKDLKVTVTPDPLTTTTTVDYALNDPALIPSLSDGETCYVLNNPPTGTAFEGREGSIMVYDLGTTSWSVQSNPAKGNIIKAEQTGITNEDVWFIHTAIGAGGAIYKQIFTDTYVPRIFVDYNGGNVEIYNELGLSVGSFEYEIGY